MKISYDWLTDYVSTDLPPEVLAERLTMAGLEVDGLEAVGSSLDGVVVGEVLGVHAHPNADRLVLCDVDVGTGETVQIACGAPNIAAGQKVPVATPGTALMLPSRDDPDRRTAVTIQETNLRGERSQGMICAEDELGLSDDHSGIMVLHEDAEIGRPFSDYLRSQGLAAQDAIFDIDLTPNRPDAASHLGVARDVAAFSEQLLHRPDVPLPEAGGETAEAVRVEIQAPKACPRYVGMVVRDVEIRESPAWLKRRLESIGLRPRNNVVDVTNFVLHECGQPLHAFDLDRLAGPEIVVRCCEGEEPFTTLDGQERTLPEGALLICDAERPVAVAGVMGGENSEVGEATTNVFIESAYFDPSSIRRTAKALGLSTDASYRFERGVDRDGQVWAAARAAHLIAEMAGGTVVPGLIDEHPTPYAPRELTLRPARANQLLGTELSTDTIAGLLERLGFAITRGDELIRCAPSASERPEAERGSTPGVEVLLGCTVPPFRPDVTHEIDLIEEVARLYGYDRISVPAHTSLPTRPPHEAPADTLHQHAQVLLTGLGFREIYTNSLLPKETAERFNVPLPGAEAGAVIQTLRPISEEMAALRPRLLPGLLDVMQHNRNHGQRVLRFFEFGHAFHRSTRKDTLIRGYVEREHIILGASGPHAEEGWDTTPHATDFFDLKGVVEALLEAVHLPAVTMRPANGTPVEIYRLDVYTEDVPLGTLARVTDDVAASFDMDAPVFFAELDWSTLTTQATPHLRRGYEPVSRFPVVERDLAIIVGDEQPAGELLDTIRTTGAPLLKQVHIFDRYTGEGVSTNEKSLAFRLRFGADRTLQDEEVDTAIASVTEALQERHDATLRG